MKSVWIIDADGIESIEEGLNNLLKTNSVNEFLDDEKKLGVSAKKGFGKTFLLKVKRDNMQGKNGVICIPSNSMVDVICTPKFGESVVKFFEDYMNWVFLWQASIAFSIINQISQREKNNYLIKMIKNNTLLNDIDRQIILDVIESNYSRPSEFFSIILTLDRKKVNVIFKNIGFILNMLKNIHMSICVFIDKIDQAFANQVKHIVGQTKMSVGSRNASFWQYAQLALMETAYTFISINQHIKIYFSIREEALIDAEKISDVFDNLKQYFVSINYTEDDLKKMVRQYISNENDNNLVYPDLKFSNPIKAFLGIEKINSKYVKGFQENVLDYILRHTFMRPRDIMDICYHLYLANLKEIANKKSDEIRAVVNRESMIIFETLLSETKNSYMSITRTHLRKLCDLIDYNILKDDKIKKICLQFNEIMQLENDDAEIFECNRNCESCDGFHPFCYLYRIGLIGVLWESRNLRQSIRFPILNDIIIGNVNHVLPSSKLYFLHPCFASRAEHIRKENNKSFSFDRNIVVGNGQKISESKLDAINRSLNEHSNSDSEPTIFISSTCYDLHDQRVAIDDMLSGLGFHVIRSDGNKFNASLNGVHSHDHCIDEMLKCRYLIFIIGKRYGGQYAGENYKKYAQEIQKIDPKLEKPSISLMEYYIASKKGIDTFVFVDSDVYNERLTYKTNLRNNITISPAHAGDTRIFHIIDLVTKRSTNNWLREYLDLQSLEEFIRIDFESKMPNHDSNYSNTKNTFTK